MTHPSRAKGTSYERELVNQAALAGQCAERAWGSDGRSRGWAEGVDLHINGCRVQAKRRKKLPAFLKPPEGADVVAFREDRGSSYAMLTWEDFLPLLNEAGGW